MELFEDGPVLSHTHISLLLPKSTTQAVLPPLLFPLYFLPWCLSGSVAFNTNSTAPHLCLQHLSPLNSRHVYLVPCSALHLDVLGWCPFQVMATPFFRLLSHPDHLSLSHTLHPIQQQILRLSLQNKSGI